MKTLIVLFSIILSVQSFAQIYPDEFPKIGYTDMYWLAHNPQYQNRVPGIVDYSDSSYFYPQMVELGLTHVTTYGNTNFSLNPSYNTSIKILDEHFSKWQGQNNSNPAKYSSSMGNATDHLAYEAGGDIAILTESDHNFGFGNSDHSSWWIYSTSNNQCDDDADHNKLDFEYNRVVHYMEAGDGPGIILAARLTYRHSFRGYHNWPFQYKFYIEAKIDGSVSEHTPVAEVRIYEIPINSPDEVSSHYRVHSEYQDEPDGQLVDFTYTIYADNFDFNNYTTLESDYFLKGYDLSDLGIEITMMDSRNLYVDRIAVSNRFNEYRLA
jgi:hypothetical protein